MHLLRTFVLALTCLMLAMHLGTALFLGRMRKAGRSTISGVLQFEALYYAVLLVYAGLSRRMSLLLPATLLAAVHMAAMVATEQRWVSEGSYRRSGVIAGVRMFDAVEALVLAWIVYLFVR